jgi:hypothetical protein
LRRFDSPLQGFGASSAFPNAEPAAARDL